MFKNDFPSLQNGQVVYLDSAASAQKPQCVIDTMSNIMKNSYANIHRGLYGWSQDLTQAYEDVRVQTAAFIGAPSKNEIVFTRNSTEAINLVAQSWGRQFLKEGDEIILSEMEHHANIVPWQLLRDQIGIVIKVIPVNDNASLDINAYKELLSPRTKMVSIVHISNATGVVNNIKEIIEIAKNYSDDVQVLIDGSQSIVHRVINISDIGCDFFVFTGHKLYGPTGVGALWGREALLNKMLPYQGGGDMIEAVTMEQSTYKSAPAKFEAGTPAILEVIGLGAAIQYMTDKGIDKIIQHEEVLSTYAQEQLSTIDGLTILGQDSDRIGVFSMVMNGVHTSDIAMVLDQMNIAVRTGHHCCMPLMQKFEIEGTVRASIGMYNDKQDIDHLVDGLQKARKMLS